MLFGKPKLAAKSRKAGAKFFPALVVPPRAVTSAALTEDAQGFVADFPLEWIELDDEENFNG